MQNHKQKYMPTLGEIFLTENFEKQLANIVTTDEASSPVPFNKALRQRKSLRKQMDSQIVNLYRLMESAVNKDEKKIIHKLVRLIRLQKMKVEAQIKELSKFKTYYRF